MRSAEKHTFRKTGRRGKTEAAACLGRVGEEGRTGREPICCRSDLSRSPALPERSSSSMPETYFPMRTLGAAGTSFGLIERYFLMAARSCRVFVREAAEIELERRTGAPIAT